jgi:hypothetical protein
MEKLTLGRWAWAWAVWELEPRVWSVGGCCGVSGECDMRAVAALDIAVRTRRQYRTHAAVRAPGPRARVRSCFVVNLIGIKSKTSEYCFVLSRALVARAQPPSRDQSGALPCSSPVARPGICRLPLNKIKSKKFFLEIQNRTGIRQPSQLPTPQCDSEQ